MSLSDPLHSYHPNPDKDDEPAPKRRRRRPALSCEQCRRRKMKCDRGDPCTQCVQARRQECTYSSHPPHADAARMGPSNQHHQLAVAARFFSDAEHGRIHDSPSGVAYPTPQTFPSISPTPGTPSTSCFGKRTGVGGTISKTRLFGQSHWMHSFGRFDSISRLRHNPILNSASFKQQWSKTEIVALIRRCKIIAKTEKAAIHNEWLQTSDLKTLIPSREISDSLTNLYFSTGESMHRILHYPSFQKEYQQYWSDPSSANEFFILKMLLAMANGAIFYQAPDVDNIRTQSKKWIFAGQHWLSHTPSEKKRLCISGLQIHCLLILARQAHGIVGDLAWVSIGTLIRSGFNMGLQRDPKFFPEMSQMQGEMRKRLWTTILELNVQLSLDMGMNPLISTDDYDTGPPGNFDDSDLDDYSPEVPAPKDSHVFTQTSVQRVLWETLPLRIRACRMINDFRGDPSYETVLEIGSLLTKACKEAMLRTDHSRPGKYKMSQLQRNALDISIRRFLFLIHGSYCVKALTDPRYYFSRKVCLDSAIIMATYPTSEDGVSVMPLDQYPRDQHTLLKIFSADFFKRVMLHSSMTIFHDYLQQVEDDMDSPAVVKEQGRRAREPLMIIMKDIIELVAARISFDVSNAKAHLFMSAIMGQLEAIEAGRSPDMGGIEGARKSAVSCLAMLDARRSKFSVPGTVQNDFTSEMAPDTPTPVEESPLGQFDLDDFNAVLDGANSWLFAGWENDMSW